MLCCLFLISTHHYYYYYSIIDVCVCNMYICSDSRSYCCGGMIANPTRPTDRPTTLQFGHHQTNRVVRICEKKPIVIISKHQFANNNNQGGRRAINHFHIECPLSVGHMDRQIGFSGTIAGHVVCNDWLHRFDIELFPRRCAALEGTCPDRNNSPTWLLY